MFNVYFWNKNEKMFQRDLSSYLKEETWLGEQVLLYIFWTCNAWIQNISEFQCGQISLDMRNFVKIPKYEWNITCLKKPEF